MSKEGKNEVYINPLTDFGFKYIFGQEKNKVFLLSFLNSLRPEGPKIEDVEFMDKEQVSENKDGRALIYDLHCRTANGGKIIVEMQNRYQTNFDDRALFYLSKDIVNQANKGKDWSYKLTPVYGVFLMNFEWREDPEPVLRDDVYLMNIRTHKVFSDKMSMTFLKIPMMVKNPEECRDTLDRWIYLFKNMETMETIPSVFMKDPIFRELDHVAKVGALNREDKQRYDVSLKRYRDWYAVLDTAITEGRAEGRAEGLAEGRAEGRAEGLAEGRAEGRAEGLAEGRAEGLAEGRLKQSLETAKKMIELGMDNSVISLATNLSADKIDTLRDSL
ncbi:MAG: Rpn family recombination-promoting nuclease/putative transposase [Muribaculaceae bacterium]|nr:Rpn family recombination-promoting nuclease/putative transposase [Muribaculaceae bacterium]